MRLLAILLIVVLAACAAPGNDPSMTDRPTPEPSLSVASPQPSLREGKRAGDITITGLLGSDSIEGGCPYLEADDGTRYQVLWPTGWELDSRGDLVDPSGEAVAGLGDEVTVRGRVADDMASICQIGPIFRASEVDHP
jgi:hypothetical protein